MREHGYTSGCLGRTSIVRGRARQAHSKACRERFEQILNNTDRYKAAEERLNRYCEEKLEEDEERRKRTRTETKLDPDTEMKPEAVNEEVMVGASAGSSDPNEEDVEMQAGVEKRERDEDGDWNELLEKR